MNDRRRNLLILLLVAGLLAASLTVIFLKPTRLGLDLKGGVSLTYQAKPTKQAQVTGDSINRAIDVMRKRVDQLGVAEPEIQRTGQDQIDVSLPAANNADEARKQVGTTAQLFFYDWEKNVLGPGCKPAPTDANVTGGPAAGSASAGLTQYDAVKRAEGCQPTNHGNETTKGSLYVVDDQAKKVLAGPEEDRVSLNQTIRDKRLRIGGSVRVAEVPQGTIVVRAEKASAKSAAPNAFYVLRDDPALSGKDIKNPEQNFDNGAGGSGAPNVTFEFSDAGRKAWQQTTRQIAQRGQSQFFGGDPQTAFQHFAIVLDGEVISAPYIDFNQNPDGIDGRQGSEISGGFTIGSAQELANLLKTGALPIKLDLISSSQVSATLGKQALDQGLIAGIAGFVVVALFLLAFYRVLGLIAVGALAVYAIFFFALIKLIPITLTLPGIAGLILTIGVAADANIVIFERVKEEIRAGRSVTAAIAVGYRKGLSAIVDANVVTFMVAFILFILATAGIKGFAFTLGVGTLVAFFTAVVLTQAVLGLAGRSRLITHPAAFGGANHQRRAPWSGFDFMGASKWFFSFSGVILAIGAIAIGGNGLNFGIDFESGTRIKTELVKKADENGVRSVLQAAGEPSAEVQRLSGKEIKSGNGFQISTEELPPSISDFEGKHRILFLPEVLAIRQPRCCADRRNCRWRTAACVAAEHGHVRPRRHRAARGGDTDHPAGIGLEGDRHDDRGVRPRHLGLTASRGSRHGRGGHRDPATPHHCRAATRRSATGGRAGDGAGHIGHDAQADAPGGHRRVWQTGGGCRLLPGRQDRHRRKGRQARLQARLQGEFQRRGVHQRVPDERATLCRLHDGRRAARQ